MWIPCKGLLGRQTSKQSGRFLRPSLTLALFVFRVPFPCFAVLGRASWETSACMHDGRIPFAQMSRLYLPKSLPYGRLCAYPNWRQSLE